MRKPLVILGIVLGAVAVEGIAFFISSRIPLPSEVPVEVERPSSFTEMLTTAERFRANNDLGSAISWARLALDSAETQPERAEASYQMGRIQLEDYRRDQQRSLDGVGNYLEAAYEDTTDDDLKKRASELLLDVAEIERDGVRFRTYFQMVSKTELSEAKRVDLWRRNLRFHLKTDTWPEMRSALATATQLPALSPEWESLIKDMHLRADERLVDDTVWFDAYAADFSEIQPAQLKSDLAKRTILSLDELSKTGTEEQQQEVPLRLSRLMLAIGEVDAGNEYLQTFLNSNPSEDLREALILLSRIMRARGEVQNAGKLAKALVQRFDFNRHTADEVAQVVDLLRENDRYDEALKIVTGALKLVGEGSSDMAQLLARAVILEELKGNRAEALDYMSRLVDINSADSLSMVLKQVVGINVGRSDYEGAEKWILRCQENLAPGSAASHDILFTLFDVKFWLNRSPLDQLAIGSAAVQGNPRDPRVALVLLRMAGFVEEMRLYELSISYYNRIGLLNFIGSGDETRADRADIGEQAMLGKARCLYKSEEWVAADHLLREIVNRTSSPLVKSEAAVFWGSLALRFGQQREAERRFGLAHLEMLSASMKARYLLGQARLGQQDEDAFEKVLELLDGLPEGERREVAYMIFNDRFNDISAQQDHRSLLRLIDLSLQSEHRDWLPTLSYVLHDLFSDLDVKKLGAVKEGLREAGAMNDAALMDLAKTVDNLIGQSQAVELYNKRKTK